MASRVAIRTKGKKKKLGSSYNMELVSYPEIEQGDWFVWETNS